MNKVSSHDNQAVYYHFNKNENIIYEACDKPYSKKSCEKNLLDLLSMFELTKRQFKTFTVIKLDASSIQYDTNEKEGVLSIYQIAKHVFERYQTNYVSKKGSWGLAWDWLKSWFVFTEIQMVQGVYNEIYRQLTTESQFHQLMRARRIFKKALPETDDPTPAG